ncbi:MAG: hypothetical protein KA735_00395 [Burkholderiaceae bacterium]|nr:hypothetical protein [Burkholderiaceae bacterium]
METQKKHDNKSSGADVQNDDTPRDQQKSHGTQQHRSKKEGHATQIGSGHDQQSSRADKAHNKR